jgi:pimeloyl-ACP methyl ester carboxylesterase
VGIDPQSQFVELETPRVLTHVLEAGSPDDEPPLVFVHGSAAFGAFLAPLMAQFDGVGLIAFDRPGYGLSDPFVYTEGNLRRTVVDVLEGVLDELEIDRVDLVGHSMGGHASILFALEHPDRVGRIATLGAIPGFPGTRLPFPLRLLTVPLLNRLVQRMQKSGEAGVLDVAAIFGEREAIQGHPAFIRAIAAADADPKSAKAGISEFDALGSILGWHSSARIEEDELRNLGHPTTVIWGDHDPLGAPGDVRDGVELIPDVRFETVDSGHIPYLAHPERCARLIRETRDGLGRR